MMVSASKIAASLLFQLIPVTMSIGAEAEKFVTCLAVNSLAKEIMITPTDLLVFDQSTGEYVALAGYSYGVETQHCEMTKSTYTCRSRPFLWKFDGEIKSKEKVEIYELNRFTGSMIRSIEYIHTGEIPVGSISSSACTAGHDLRGSASQRF